MPVLNLLKGRIRQHISKLMNSYILHDESRSFIRGVDESCDYISPLSFEQLLVSCHLDIELQGFIIPSQKGYDYKQ
jgi:hypothetical protein